MQRNTSITLGDHFSKFIQGRIEQGRFENTSEAIRAGLRLLELEETKIDLLRTKLAEGEAQLDSGQGIIFNSALMEEIDQQAMINVDKGSLIDNPDVLP